MIIIPRIPFSGSLAFQAADDDSAGPRVHVGFTPRWFAQYMELDYGPTWHSSPRARLASMQRMAEVLNERLPELRLGGRPDAMRGTISQVQTCAFMAALFGQPIHYSTDAWPDNQATHLSDAEADALAVPDFRSHPVYANLMEQMDIIEREWGPIAGDLNYQGVLNTAFRLRGEAIFMDMAMAPERADHVLDVVCDTMLAFVGDVHDRQRASGVHRDFFVTANCVVNMISADYYRRFVMPRDRRLAGHWQHFGVHNCAWCVDPYVPAYAELPDLAYLDFGFDSDLETLRRACPHTTLAAMYSPTLLSRSSHGQLRASLERLFTAIPNAHLIVADIDAGTPDEQIREIFRSAAAVTGMVAEQLIPLEET